MSQYYIDVLVRVKVETSDIDSVLEDINIEVDTPQGQVLNTSLLESQLAGECISGVLIRRDEDGNIVGTGRDAFIASQPDYD
jgi:hypothetical protein